MYPVTDAQVIVGNEIEMKDLISIIFSFISLVGAGVAFFITQTQKKKILALQNNEERRNLIHRYQFEKEFEIYQLLWSKLVQFDTAQHKLKSYRMNTSDEEMIAKNRLLIEEFNLAYKELQHSFVLNKPFYSNHIFDEVKQIIDLGAFSAIDISHELDKSYRQALKNSELIGIHLESVNIRIKERIQFIELNQN